MTTQSHAHTFAPPFETRTFLQPHERDKSIDAPGMVDISNIVAYMQSLDHPAIVTNVAGSPLVKRSDDTIVVRNAFKGQYNGFVDELQRLGAQEQEETYKIKQPLSRERKTLYAKINQLFANAIFSLFAQKDNTLTIQGLQFLRTLDMALREQLPAQEVNAIITGALSQARLSDALEKLGIAVLNLLPNDNAIQKFDLAGVDCIGIDPLGKILCIDAKTNKENSIEVVEKSKSYESIVESIKERRVGLQIFDTLLDMQSEAVFMIRDGSFNEKHAKNMFALLAQYMHIKTRYPTLFLHLSSSRKLFIEELKKIDEEGKKLITQFLDENMRFLYMSVPRMSDKHDTTLHQQTLSRAMEMVKEEGGIAIDSATLLQFARSLQELEICGK